MTRYFALPVIAVVLGFAGLRFATLDAPAEPAPRFIVALPEPEPSQEIPVPPPAATPSAAPAPSPEPIVIVLEPLPHPVMRTEIVERAVPVSQTTIINTTTNNYYPVVVVEPAPAPEPKREIVEVPVIDTVFVQPVHPPKKPAVPQQDPFFRTIPFQPPVPRHPALR